MRKWMLAVVVAVVFGFSGAAQAESYISGFAGLAIPHDSDAEDNEGIGIVGTAEFDSGITFGAKAGHWFTEQQMPFLGVQLEISRYSADADFKADVSSLVGIPSTMVSSTEITVTSYMANILFRKADGKLRPHAGIGLGWISGDIDNGTTTITSPGFGVIASADFNGADDTAFGWQILAGIDYDVAPKFSIFGEYKYTRADFSFGPDVDFDVDYAASQIYGGVSYHF